MPRTQLRMASLIHKSRHFTFLLLAAACCMQVDARTESTQTAPMEIAPPGVQPIESSPINRPSIAPITVTVPRIEPAPMPRTRPASPISPPTALLAQDTGIRAIQEEIQRLQRSASPASGYGSTAAAARAAWQLGLIYLHGAGVRMDRVLAQQWFERAARQGREPWAFAGLAWCTIDSCSGQLDPSAATPAINRLRSEHPARADFLTWLQLTRLKPLHINAPNTSGDAVADPGRQLLERAAERGDVQANIELGIMAFASKDSAKAQAYFARVASRSSIAADNLQQLRALETNSHPGAQAAAEGSADSALNMARMYHRGDGVPANYAEALRFYRLAEQRGSAEAHKMIELIFSVPNGSFNPAWMRQLANADLSRPSSMIASGVTAHQLRREASPLSDLLAPIWKKRLQKIAP